MVSRHDIWRHGRGADRLVDAWRITPLVRSGAINGVLLVLPATYSARYDLLEIQDTGNAAGYVEVARVGIFDLTMPTYSPAYGLQDKRRACRVSTARPAARCGSIQQRSLREVSFVLPYLSLTEGDGLHELQRAGQAV